MRFSMITAGLMMTLAAAAARAQTLPAATAPHVPPSAPAPAPSAEAAARDALHHFFRAMLAGDDKTALTFITFTKPENAKVCAAFFAQQTASQRLLAVVTEQFGKESAAQLGIEPDDTAAEIEKNLGQAKVTLNGETAEIVADPNMPPFVLVRKQGEWRLDFEKTQENMGPPPKLDSAALMKIAAGYDRITAEIKAKNLTNIGMVKDAVHDAQVVTTTTPASDLPAR